MKTIFSLLCLSSFISFAVSQVNMQGCQTEWLSTTYVLSNTGTTNDGGTIRNTYETTPIDGAQGCFGFGLGFCEMRIRWSTANARWEVDLTDGVSFFNMYYNTSASVPNPPDLSLGSWVENTAVTSGGCGTGLTILSGDVQSTIVLPVSWASFEVAPIAGAVDVKWATYQEVNSHSFEVERSQDGLNYQVLSVLDAQGKSVSLHSYAFRDLNPLVGQSYYRIKQIDADGEYSYSKVKTILIEQKPLALVPLPAQKLSVQYAFKAGAKVQLRDLRGVIQLNRQIGEAKSEEVLDLNSLAAGLYVIEIHNGKERILKKWIKY